MGQNTASSHFQFGRNKKFNSNVRLIRTCCLHSRDPWLDVWWCFPTWPWSVWCLCTHVCASRLHGAVLLCWPFTPPIQTGTPHIALMLWNTDGALNLSVTEKAADSHHLFRLCRQQCNILGHPHYVRCPNYFEQLLDYFASEITKKQTLIATCGLVSLIIISNSWKYDQ